MTIYYIANAHFGHKAVIRMCERPFQIVDEMDRTLIDNWNCIVSDEDEVYIIGDFIDRSTKHPTYYLEKLKGKKHLIVGNHERWIEQVELQSFFESVSNYKKINDSNQHIVLFHYPIAEWARYNRGGIRIFGHIHNKREGAAYEYYLSHSNMLNAGVDVNQFMPVTLEQLKDNNDMFRRRR